MTVREAIAARRSIRRFEDRPVPRDLLLELVEAARLAPSGCNAQPWRFKIVNDAADVQWIGTGGSPQRWAGRAGAVLVCCVDTQAFLPDSRRTIRLLAEAGLMPPDMKAGIDSYLDRAEAAPAELLKASAGMNLAIALSFVMLRAVELGLGSTWMGMFHEAAVKERFAIPERLSVLALLAVGWPAESPEPRPRKSLAEILLP